MGSESEFDQETYDTLKKAFEDVKKRIGNYSPTRKEPRTLPTDLTERQNKVSKYTLDLIEAYNNFVKFIGEEYSTLHPDSKNTVRDKIQNYKQGVLASLTILDLFVNLPSDFEPIDINKITKLGLPEPLDTSQIFVSASTFENSNSEEFGAATGGVQEKRDNNASETNLDEIVKQTLENNFVVINQTQVTMAITKIEFFNLCSRTISNNFSGDPLALTAFINSIKLLESMVENVEHTAMLKSFIMTKLTGSAQDAVPNDPATVDVIINALKGAIKPENSKIVMGKMIALKADRTNFTDYAKKVETLSESLKRSLILEGYPSDKANEVTIEKTKELCRGNTTSPVVKACLDAAVFNDAKEVVSKFIIESRLESATEAQVFSFNSNRGNRNYSNNFNNNRGRGRNFNRNNFQNNFQNNFRNQYRQNNQNGYNRGYQNGNNFRGRGRVFRGNYNNNQNNNVYLAENQPAPPPGAQNQNVQMHQAGSSQS